MRGGSKESISRKEHGRFWVRAASLAQKKGHVHKQEAGNRIGM